MKFYARLGFGAVATLFVLVLLVEVAGPLRESKKLLQLSSTLNSEHPPPSPHSWMFRPEEVHVPYLSPRPPPPARDPVARDPRSDAANDISSNGVNRKLLKSLILDMKRNMSSARWLYFKGEGQSRPPDDKAFSSPYVDGDNHRKCAEPLCYEYLSREDRKNFAYCHRRSQVRTETAVCRFMNGTGRAPVALASFPGSGNTWVRGLLQRSTGLCTGGIYCDRTLRVADYPGESIRSGAVLVVKTHDPLPRWAGGSYLRLHPYMDQYGKPENIPLFQSAIFLVRNPFHALVSEWNRIGTEKELDSHTGHVGRTWFENNTEWGDFVKNKAQEWRTMLESYVLHRSGHPVLVVRYEDLRTHPLEGLRLMLNFLQQPYLERDLEQLVEAGYTVFYRTHPRGVRFKHFTAEQVEVVVKEVRNVVDLLVQSNQLHECDIREYLNTSYVS